MSRPWTDEEVHLLGTRADADVGRMIGRLGKAVWAKRQALGIAAPPSLVRHWTEGEDRVVLSRSMVEAAKQLRRTVLAVRIRKRRLLHACRPEAAPKLLSLEDARLRIEVPRYDSAEQEELVRFVGGPYSPPLVAIGGWLKCALRGRPAGGRLHERPHPLARGGWASQATDRVWRPAQGAAHRIPAGGGVSYMTPEAREALRRIQQRPKTRAWKERMSEHWSRRFALLGPPRRWTEDELKLIGTKPDREVARLLNRSLSAVKAKKFQFKLGRADHS